MAVTGALGRVGVYHERGAREEWGRKADERGCCQWRQSIAPSPENLDAKWSCKEYDKGSCHTYSKSDPNTRHKIAKEYPPSGPKASNSDTKWQAIFDVDQIPGKVDFR